MAGLIKKIAERKILSTIIILALAIGIYYGYQNFFGNKNAVRYVTATAKKGTLVISVSGSGQVSVSNQVDIKSKVSGEAIYVGVDDDQAVKSGASIVELDSSDAQRAVRDAEVNLESAKLALEKLKGPEGSAVSRNKQAAEDNLKRAYDDGFNNVANAFLDLPTIMTGIQNILYGTDFISSQSNINFYADSVKNYDGRAVDYAANAVASYQDAKSAYDKNFDDYKNTTRYSDSATIDALITETYLTAQKVAEAIKNTNNTIQFYEDRLAEHNIKPLTLANTHLGSLNTYTGKVNTHLLNLLSNQSAIKNSKDSITNADLDIKTQELSVKQRENTLEDAKINLDYYFIRAPFDGILAKINVKKGDSVSPSTVIGTLVTHQKIAEVSLNEIDAAKIKVGQKTTLTFDAIPELGISGSVAEIDTLGTITQGVVTYNVKIVFDTQDERVKSGMSASAAIITDIKQDVILVPNAAVKSNGNQRYVEILVNNVPQNIDVVADLSNDTETEIVTGLKESDQIVTQTVTASSASTQTQQNTGLRIPGLTGGGGIHGGATGR